MEKFIIENIEHFIVEDDLVLTHKNIKEFSIDCSLISIMIQEELKQVYTQREATYIYKTLFESEVFKTRLKAGGKLFLNNLKDVFFDAAMSKKLGLISSGISIANLISKYSISNLIMAKGLGMTATTSGVAATSGTAAIAAAGGATTAIFSIGLFFALILGVVAYNMVKKQSLVLIYTFQKSIKELSSDLKSYNKELEQLEPRANKLYKEAVDSRCGGVDKKNKRELFMCGTINFMELNANYVIPELFKGYVRYLIKKNFDISYAVSASEIFNYPENRDRTGFYAKKLYRHYNEIFFDLLKSRTDVRLKCIKIINTKCKVILKEELSNVGK